MGKLSSKKFLMSAWLPLLHPDRWVFIWGGGNEVKAKNITSFLEDGGKVSSGQLTFDHSHRLMWAWARQDEERRRKRRHKGGGRRPLSFLLLFSLARPWPFLSLYKKDEKMGWLWMVTRVTITRALRGKSNLPWHFLTHWRCTCVS